MADPNGGEGGDCGEQAHQPPCTREVLDAGAVGFHTSASLDLTALVSELKGIGARRLYAARA
jgi:hypothetical protein